MVKTLLLNTVRMVEVRLPILLLLTLKILDLLNLVVDLLFLTFHKERRLPILLYDLGRLVVVDLILINMV